MLLARIKEALDSLYDDIQETQEAPEAAEIETVAAEAAVEEPAAATAEQEESKPEEAEEPATPPGPKETDYQAKGYHLDVELDPDKVVTAVEILNRENFFIESITGVDWIDDQQLEAVYDFNHFDELCRVVIRTRTDRNNPAIPTISHIYQGANWHERETHDFFGIKFTGHPNLEPLLLPEDADFHPLLKDFKA
ncbi:MAG: NADH-quinone oxidoreductase subunit C [Desulfobacterales bacterium]|nr:NADH-quinone oxidoreductase subunit C [Desulfobacterales bacterium]